MDFDRDATGLRGRNAAAAPLGRGSPGNFWHRVKPRPAQTMSWLKHTTVLTSIGLLYFGVGCATRGPITASALASYSHAAYLQLSDPPVVRVNCAPALPQPSSPSSTAPNPPPVVEHPASAEPERVPAAAETDAIPGLEPMVATSAAPVSQPLPEVSTKLSVAQPELPAEAAPLSMQAFVQFFTTARPGSSNQIVAILPVVFEPPRPNTPPSSSATYTSH
jgi:hypothetical protein